MVVRAAPRVKAGPVAHRRAAIGGIVGPVAFVSAWVTGGIVAHHYSSLHRAISHLAQIGASTRPLMTTGFVVFGVSVPVYAMSLRRELAGPSWIAAGASGLATLGVAAAPLGRGSAGDAVHGTFAGAGYVALALTPLLAAGPLRRTGRHAAARASVTIAAVSAGALAASTFTAFDGLFQRIGLTVVDAWIVASAIAIARGGITPRRPGADRAKLPR